MADDPTQHAIHVVARHMVALGRHDDHDVWGLYPEIGENDWTKVLWEADRLVAGLRPADEAYEAAYQHLEQRAGGF
jgi:hypothetical protein